MKEIIKELEERLLPTAKGDDMHIHKVLCLLKDAIKDFDRRMSNREKINDK